MKKPKNINLDKLPGVEHLILTKFNVRSFEDSILGCNTEWLKKRFSYFDSFCFPSVKNQTNKHFKWLVFFDSNTPELFKQKISEYAQELVQFIPVFLPIPLPYGMLPDVVKPYIAKHIQENCEYLITTWLDNDDAICKDYIAMIQNYFNLQECESVNFMIGYQACGKKLYLDFEVANHFISIIEKYNPITFKSCLGGQHKELYRVCNSVLKVFSKPAWMEVVHDTNYMNVYRHGIRINNKNITNEFGIYPFVCFKVNSAISFIFEQISILVVLPYYLIRRIYLRIINKELGEFKNASWKFQ